MAYYANEIDYNLAKASNPSADVRLYTPGATLGSGDYYLGNASGINLNGATALTGADRYATNQLFNNQIQTDNYNSMVQAVQNAQAQQQAQIEALKQAQIQASIAALDKSKAASLSALQQEKAAIQPAYQKQKIQAGVTAKQNARSFDEYMAQRGGGAAKSGIGAQGQLMNNVAYQGNIGALNEAEANALTSNAQRVTDTENAYQSDVAAAQAGAAAQAMQMQIQANQQAAQNELAMRQWLYENQQNQNNNLFDRDMTLAQLTGIIPSQYGGGQTLSAQQQAFNNYLNQRELEIAQQKAYSGGSGSTSLDKNQAFAQAAQGLESLANGTAAAANGKRFTRSEILNFILQHASDFASNGVDFQKLYKWASEKYTWEG